MSGDRKDPAHPLDLPAAPTAELPGERRARKSHEKENAGNRDGPRRLVRVVHFRRANLDLHDEAAASH